MLSSLLVSALLLNTAMGNQKQVRQAVYDKFEEYGIELRCGPMMIIFINVFIFRFLQIPHFGKQFLRVSQVD